MATKSIEKLWFILRRFLSFVLSFLSWFVSIYLMFKLGLLEDVNPDILLLAHLAAFFFTLTTSPVTWIIKGFGVEIGSNTPTHFQIDKGVVENGKRTDVIIRDYSHSHNAKEMNEILSKQSKD